MGNMLNPEGNQMQILDFPLPNPKDVIIQNFLARLCEGHDKLYRSKKCVECGSSFEYDKEGKPIRYLMTCNSPFCKDEECFKKRYMIAKKYFEVYFNAYSSWKTKRGSRWIHEVFGFPRVNKLTKSYLSKCKKQLYNFLKAREKKFDIKIKGVGVRDLSYDVEKVGEEFYLHFHFAKRFSASEDLIELNSLASKYGLKYSKIGVRKRSGLINYFSKRHAGYFGHKKKETNWSFQDLFSAEDYIDIFRGERKTFSCGFSRKEIRLLKERYLAFRTRLEEALGSKEQQTTDTKQCQKCGCREYSWIFENEVHDPPPNTEQSPQTIEVKYVKF